MFENFVPNEFAKNISEIDISTLKNRGIKGLLIDIDNTISKDNSKDIEPDAIEFVKNALSRGIKVCLMSNNNKKRVEPIGVLLDCPTLHKAGKPGVKAYTNAMAKIGIDKKETAMIGDQLFTDIYGGNKAGLHTILVLPIDLKNEIIFIKIKRPFERMMLKIKKVNF